MRMRSAILLSALALILVVGCRSADVLASPPPAPYIELVEEGAGQWRVSWHFPEPVRSLVFDRQTPFRKDAFEVLTSGYYVSREGESEVLRTDGTPARVITVRFGVFDRELTKDYELVQAFSDGSAAIYTGHLLARAADGAEECDSCLVQRFVIDSDTRREGLIRGEYRRFPYEWTDESGRGTYVYFGQITPVANDAMVSIIDPALPGWISELTSRSLPRLFSLYERRFGVAPPTRPTVLMSYVAAGESGYETSGGTLPGLLQLQLRGRAWREPSDEALRHVMKFLAHEAVHIWNGEVVHYPDTADAWMHEGSADALALQTLVELQIIDQEQYWTDQSAALNECRRGLRGLALSEAAARGQFSLYYSCGNMLAVFTERSVDADLFEFWRSLIARAGDDDQYGVEDYLENMSALGAGGDAVEALRSFTAEEATPERLEAMLARTGLRMETAEPPQPYRESLARDALFALLGGICRGSYGLRSETEGFRLNDPLNCGQLPAGGVVTSIAGHDVVRDGHLVWDALHEKCAAREPVNVHGIAADGESFEATVACTVALAARPDYLVIEPRS